MFKHIFNPKTIALIGASNKPKKVGTGIAENMIKSKKVKQYKEPTFMNIIRKRIFQKYPQAIITYGSETSPYRKELGLEKTHYNDAIAITKIENIKVSL